MEFNTLCLILCIAAVVLCAVFFAAGILYRKKVAEKQIGSAEEEAKRIINEAIKGGESKKREMLLEAKEEIHRTQRIRTRGQGAPRRGLQAGAPSAAEGRSP